MPFLQASMACASCCVPASEDAPYITGAVFPVDGGYMLTGSAGTSSYLNLLESDVRYLTGDAGSPLCGHAPVYRTAIAS
jgi:hypothetical protein